MSSDTKNQKLFAEFPPVTTAEWKEKITTDLKGADFDRKLVWHTDLGFNVQPYYRQEDLEKITHIGSMPGEYPYVRGNKVKNNWEIRQNINAWDIAEGNQQAHRAIANGVDAINFVGGQFMKYDELKAILAGIDMEKVAIHFGGAISFPTLLALLKKYIAEKEIDASKVKGSFNFDPLSYFLIKGEFYKSFENNIEELVKLMADMKVALPQFKILSVNAQHFHNSGATAVQELAFGLSSTVEYFSRMVESGVSIDEIAEKSQFTLALGSSYFVEIAKVRAARILWTRMMEGFKPANEENLKGYIHTVSSEWNKSVYDPYVNMLRTTTEGMSGAIAASDAMTLAAFDTTFKASDEFSNRIARNQQHLLKEESHLDKVMDPSAGSYYIEQLTQSIAEEAWKLFLEVENKGGLLKAVEEGFITAQLNESSQAKDMAIATRKISILGVNQYPNTEEEMLEKISFTKGEDKGVLNRYRAAMSFETMRKQTETFIKAGNKKPVVFMLTYGNLAMRKARASFAVNFFGCGGYTAIDNLGFATAEEGMKAAKAAKADIIVLCSSDDEYVELAKACNGLIEKESMVVAGYPKDAMEALKAEKVEEFIHVKSNVIEVLNKFHNKLGIA